MYSFRVISWRLRDLVINGCDLYWVSLWSSHNIDSLFQGNIRCVCCVLYNWNGARWRYVAIWIHYDSLFWARVLEATRLISVLQYDNLLQVGGLITLSHSFQEYMGPLYCYHDGVGKHPALPFGQSKYRLLFLHHYQLFLKCHLSLMHPRRVLVDPLPACVFSFAGTELMSRPIRW